MSGSEYDNALMEAYDTYPRPLQSSVDEKDDNWDVLHIADVVEEEPGPPPECPTTKDRTCWSYQPSCSSFDCNASNCTAPPYELICPSVWYRSCEVGSGECWWTVTGYDCVENPPNWDCVCRYAYTGNNCS